MCPAISPFRLSNTGSSSTLSLKVATSLPTSGTSSGTNDSHDFKRRDPGLPLSLFLRQVKTVDGGRLPIFDWPMQICRHDFSGYPRSTERRNVYPDGGSLGPGGRPGAYTSLWSAAPTVRLLDFVVPDKTSRTFSAAPTGRFLRWQGYRLSIGDYAIRNRLHFRLRRIVGTGSTQPGGVYTDICSGNNG
jgi:hypothetical protein